MPALARLRRGDWRIDDSDRGWVLRFRLKPSWQQAVPRSRRQWVGLSLLVLFFLVEFGLAVPLDAARRLHRTVAAAGVAFSLLYGAVIFVWLWLAPIRRAGREWQVTADGAAVTTDAGRFDLGALTTLRLTSQGATPGRCRLVFTGRVVKEATLVGWPGLPPVDAEGLRTAVLQRLVSGGHGPDSVPAVRS